MSKKGIRWLSLSASALTLAGLGVLIPSVVFFATWTCQRTGANGLNCQAAPESLGAGFWTSIALLIVGSAIFLIAWIGALIRAARMRDILWLIILIVGSGAATLIYGFIGPDKYPLLDLYQPQAAYPPSEHIPTYAGAEQDNLRR